LPGHVFYATVNYTSTRQLLRKLCLSAEDIFVDVGCGKGRVVCLAARHKIGQAVGIEYSEALAAIAEKNIRNLRGRPSAADIICQSAEDADYSNATVLYFFNPFEPPLLDAVLGKIQADRHGKTTRMAFVMESPAQRQVFSKHSWLACYDRFEDPDKHPVALYRTMSPP